MLKVEILVDKVSGIREIYVSVPFWIYNWSNLELAILDGDTDDLYGRQERLQPMAMKDQPLKHKEHFDAMFRSLRPGLAGLQSSCEPHEINMNYRHFPNHALPIMTPKHSHCKRSHCKPSYMPYPLEDCSERVGIHDDDGGIAIFPRMYSPVKGADASQHKLRIRVVQPLHIEQVHRESGELSWSTPFNLELPNGTTTVTIPQPHSKGAYVLSVICIPTLGRCIGKTKTISFRPRYIISTDW